MVMCRRRIEVIISPWRDQRQALAVCFGAGACHGRPAEDAQPAQQATTGILVYQACDITLRTSERKFAWFKGSCRLHRQQPRCWVATAAVSHACCQLLVGHAQYAMQSREHRIQLTRCVFVTAEA